MKLTTAKMTLAQKLPIAAGAALLLTAGTGAAAYALVAQSTDSPGRTGNTLPIDDNHRSITRAPLPAEDRVATPARPAAKPDDHGTDAPEVGDDKGTHAPEVGDDNGTDAPEVGDDHGTDSGDSGGSGSGGGGDDGGSGGHH